MVRGSIAGFHEHDRCQRRDTHRSCGGRSADADGMPGPSQAVTSTNVRTQDPTVPMRHPFRFRCRGSESASGASCTVCLALHTHPRFTVNVLLAFPRALALDVQYGTATISWRLSVRCWDLEAEPGSFAWPTGCRGVSQPVFRGIDCRGTLKLRSDTNAKRLDTETRTGHTGCLRMVVRYILLGRRVERSMTLETSEVINK